MPETFKLILLCLGGSVAGFINVNAGGGSSLTLPLLILMGLDGAVANGTNRLGILTQTFFAVSSFKKKNFYDFKRSFTLACFTLPGAIVGALIATRINNEWFQRILGAIMIGIVLSMIFSKKRNENSTVVSGKPHWTIYPAMVGIGFYGGFIQVGVGYLLMAALYYLLRTNLVRVNMHKVFIVFIYTIPSLAVFILTDNVNWIYGIILAGGFSLGGWWGAHIAVKGGEKAIRIVLGIAIGIMAVKLLGLF
jgi:uncharacterized membrane protein YfcA